jgi:hypothetical protein
LQPPFTKSKAGQYAALQRREALVCCKGMIENSDNWVNSVRRFAVAIMLKIAYGLEVDGPSSPWIQLAEDAANAIGKSGAPASSIMDRFPVSECHSKTNCPGVLSCGLIGELLTARYLPDWLPFMERLRYAHTWRAAIENITSMPFAASLKLMVRSPF